MPLTPQKAVIVLKKHNGICSTIFCSYIRRTTNLTKFINHLFIQYYV